MDWDRVPGVLFSIPIGLNSQTPLIFIHKFLGPCDMLSPGPGSACELTRITFRVMQKIERERITMIRWNKWTRDYTYTYEWHDGAWRLIHKESNRPVASWFGKMYSMFS